MRTVQAWSPPAPGQGCIGPCHRSSQALSPGSLSPGCADATKVVIGVCASLPLCPEDFIGFCRLEHLSSDPAEPACSLWGLLSIFRFSAPTSPPPRPPSPERARVGSVVHTCTLSIQKLCSLPYKKVDPSHWVLGLPGDRASKWVLARNGHEAQEGTPVKSGWLPGRGNAWRVKCLGVL